MPTTPAPDPNASAVQNYNNLYIQPLLTAWGNYQSSQTTATLGALEQALFNADAGMRGQGGGTGLLGVLMNDENANVNGTGDYTANDLPKTISKCCSLLYHVFEAIKDIQTVTALHQPPSAALEALKGEMRYIKNQFTPQTGSNPPFTIIDNAPTAAQTISAGMTDPAIGPLNPNQWLNPTDSINWLSGFLQTGVPPNTPGVFSSLQSLLQAISATPPNAQTYQTALVTLQTALNSAIGQVSGTVNELITDGGYVVDIKNHGGGPGECVALTTTLMASLADAKAVVDKALESPIPPLDINNLLNLLGANSSGQPIPGIAGSVWQHWIELGQSINTMPNLPTPPAT